jgi:L-ascorbate metabolism protein UlaG (beta-lactamase superfamily)
MIRKTEMTSPRLSLFSIIRWQVSRVFAKKTDNRSFLKVIKQDKIEPNSAIWLGHASLWVDVGSTKILIDPILESIPFYKRQTNLPIQKDSLTVDIILITHAHYDHFDLPSIKFLIKENPNVKIIAPIGFERYLGKHSSNLIELEWWQNITIKNIEIIFVPSLHWSNRVMTDMNKALWGGFIVRNEEYSLYHSGDTAYGEHFKEIGDRFDILDAFLPIGAYKPEYIMKRNHINPQEALVSCEDLLAKKLIPIHYGTFKLSDEGICEPLEWLRELLLEREYPFATKVANIGEVIYLTSISTLKST